MTEHSEQKPIKEPFWHWLAAPALAATYPVVALYSDSVTEVKVQDVALSGAVVVSAAIAVALLFRLVFSGAPRASLAAVLFVIWCFAFSGYVQVGRYIFESAGRSINRDYYLYYLYAFWIFLLFPVMFFLWWIRLSDHRMRQLYTFVLVGSLVSVSLSAVQGVRNYLRDRPILPLTTSIWESDRPAIPATWQPQPMTQGRDVYFLLFDRYGSEHALKEFFGYDDSKFYNELEKRGFIVDRNAIASYPMTKTAMSSTLNMRWLNSEVKKTSDYFANVETNDVGKWFKKAGYKYNFLGNQYDGLRKSNIADWNMRISTMPCEFADSLLSMTPFRSLIGRQHKRELVLEKIKALVDLAQDPTLAFTYAHFLVPHPPYAFKRDGSLQTEVNRATQPEKELYIEQLEATNELILKAIDGILAASSVKPVIILQADEGPYLMPGDESFTRDQQMAKRLGILNAFYIPDDDVRQRLPKPLLPINTFRFLFKEYFGAPIDLLPDRVFFWETPDPSGAAEFGTRIVEVTPKVMPAGKP